MSNPIIGQYDFAGVGFTSLDLSIGTIPVGTLSDETGSQPLNHLTFNNATGVISFGAAKSQTASVQDISFTGNVIEDFSGNAIGFTGSWKGRRIAVNAPPAAAIVFPNEVEGIWAAVVDRDII